eukprot:scaffold3_cov389-Prasinococcus_capsulatus_cf.AAC.8
MGLPLPCDRNGGVGDRRTEVAGSSRVRETCARAIALRMAAFSEYIAATHVHGRRHGPCRLNL